MASPNKGGRNASGSGTNGNVNEKGGGSIDRETKCPLLLRVFCATSRHNSLSDYNKGTYVSLDPSTVVIPSGLIGFKRMPAPPVNSLH